MSHFDKKAENWDSGAVRVDGTLAIANAINERVELTPAMEVIDFGVGTGLLGFEIAKRVKQVYGVDTSTKMLEQIAQKNPPELHIKTIKQDIIQNPLEQKFHGLVSSMTLHHIEDLEAFFTTIYSNLHNEGFIAIADLESEDGTFHSDNTGVFHFGFDAEELSAIAKKCGFKDVEFTTINTIKKPHRDFDVFLLSALK